ncbi:MAG TPA: Rieske (2Fe-2S) protein [Mycobacteriales bacterium]|jgi:nitrite reductase/ring-hydroxylating ferredoxin subunit
MPIGPTSLLERIEKAETLDRIVRVGQRVVHGVVPAGPIRDALHGVWLGHPAHPALVQLPIGAFVSAGVLDATGGERQARGLIVVGLAGALPAAAAGAVDWADLHEQQMRVGVVHWAGNVASIWLYAGSLLARCRGHVGLGKALGFAGLATIGTSGLIGGHLAFRQAAGANHAEQVPHLIRPGWHKVGVFADLPKGKPARRALFDVPLVVVRSGRKARVLAAQCSHLSGPLDEGAVVEIRGAPCVVCPWHQSTFRLDDGRVVRGPATASQPAFETRVRAGQLQVRLRGAG